MAARLDVAVVPVHLDGLFRIMSKFDSWPRRGPVRVEFGKPIRRRQGEEYRDLAERVESAIGSMALARDRQGQGAASSSQTS